MQKKTGFIPYDWVKLIVALLLIIAIFLVPQSSTAQTDLPAAERAPTEETVAAEPEPTQAPTAVAESEETQVPAEDDADETEASVEVELPPLPEASAALEYDAAKGGLVNADGKLVYVMNEDGSGWTPVIPAEMASMQLDAEWTLLDADGNPAYEWDAESQSWVAVEQDEVPVEEEQTSATTNIVDCPGSAEPRLEGGKNAEVLRDVNFRSSPGVGDNWIGGFSVGDQVSVMGDTACTPYGNGSYLWWQVERADGKTGWIAEAPVNTPNYFLEPVE